MIEDGAEVPTGRRTRPDSPRRTPRLPGRSGAGRCVAHSPPPAASGRGRSCGGGRDRLQAAAAGRLAAEAPAPVEHAEVSVDQETYDRVLAELLEQGTDRRVAEGRAKRAGMVAARAKAEGGS